MSGFPNVRDVLLGLFVLSFGCQIVYYERMKPLSKTLRVFLFVLTVVSVLCGATGGVVMGEDRGREVSVDEWPIVKPLPGGMFYAQSAEWHSAINERILRARELSDSLLGETNLAEYELYVADDKAQFDSLVGDELPYWGAAVAIPQLQRIVLKAPYLKPANKTPATLAAHEYAHLLVSSLSGGAAPRWLDEGLAMYFAQEWSYQDFVNVSIAAARGNMLDLRDIENLNSFSESRAKVGYAESYLAVSYLFEYYGVSGMRETLAGLRQGKSIDSALQGAFGLDEKGFEREVFADIEDNHTLLGILMGSNLFWGALALIVIIGFIRARMNRKKRYAEWDERERYESTDFDYGDPDNPEKVDDEDRPWE